MVRLHFLTFWTQKYKNFEGYGQNHIAKWDKAAMDWVVEKDLGYGRSGYSSIGTVATDSGIENWCQPRTRVKSGQRLNKTQLKQYLTQRIYPQY